MPTLEERVETPERRVSEWEGQVGFLVPLVRQLHREILTTREDVQHLNTKVDRPDSKVTQLDSKVTQLDTKVTQLDTKVNQGFAAMNEKFRKIDDSLDVLPRVIAEEIARRR
jgi:X-X-X-Leu-X-X-Gly heptad repeat protein